MWATPAKDVSRFRFGADEWNFEISIQRLRINNVRDMPMAALAINGPVLFNTESCRHIR